MIIAISGKAGAGKTLSATILYNMMKDLPNVNVKLKSFSKPVYQIASVILNQKVSHIQDNKNHQAAPYDITNREVLQLIGQSFRDLLHPDVWNNIVLDQKYNDDTDIIIIDDLRYKNEIENIKLKGSTFIFRIERETSNTKEKFRQHKSEIDLDKNQDWDTTIENNSDIESLNQKLKTQVFLTIKNKLSNQQNFSRYSVNES
tara:strand:- start:2969 stop:3574 length:606 start_codon:yes stop_codon:yes gene_type:complete